MSIPDRPVKLGVVGGGEGATKAISALKNAHFIQITKVFCLPEELNSLIDEPFRALSVDALMQEQNIEAIYIATPNHTHIPIAIKALNMGKHVMIEKPLTVSLKEFSSILEYKNSKQIISVAFKKRFNEAIKFFFHLCHKFDLISDFHFVWSISAPKPQWRYDIKKSGGGVVIDLGSHVFDMFEYFLGKINCLTATLEMHNLHSNIDKVAQVMLHMNTEQKAQLQFSWQHEQRILTLWSQSHNKKKQIVYKRVDNHDMVYYQDSHSNTSISKIFDPHLEYLGLFREFYRAIRCKSNISPRLYDGLRNHVIIESVYQSAYNSKPIIVPKVEL